MKIRSIFDFKRYIYNILKLVGRTPWQSRGYDSAFTAEGPGSIPGQGTKILQATLCDQKKKREKEKTCGIQLQLCIEDNLLPYLHLLEKLKLSDLNINLKKLKEQQIMYERSKKDKNNKDNSRS